MKMPVLMFNFFRCNTHYVGHWKDEELELVRISDSPHVSHSQTRPKSELSASLDCRYNKNYIKWSSLLSQVRTFGFCTEISVWNPDTFLSQFRRFPVFRHPDFGHSLNSEMPKSERPISEQCWNPNKCWFGFQTLGFRTFGTLYLFDQNRTSKIRTFLH